MRWGAGPPLLTAVFISAALPSPGLAADPLASVRPHHVALSVADLDESIAWYRDKLGFRPLPIRDYPTIRARGVFLERNGFLVELFVKAGSSRPNSQGVSIPDELLAQGYRHMGLQVNDVDAAITTLRAREVVIASDPEDVVELGLRLAFIRDNSGNLIEIGAPIREAHTQSSRRASQ